MEEKQFIANQIQKDEQANAPGPTPKIIHFIWAGGEKPFPNDDVLKKWQKQNPDWQIVLWVDKQSTPEHVFAAYKKDHGYCEAGVDAPSFAEIVAMQAGDVDTSEKPIVLVDITEAGVVTPAARYEIDRFRRNYGCSSDLLRYNILAEYGGAYFDSDIDPGPTPLSAVYQFDKPLFKVTGLTQDSKGIGNDAFVCSRAHPLMIGLAVFAHNNYISPSLMPNDPDLYDTMGNKASGNTQRDWDTVARTGPSAVEEYLKNQKMIIRKNHQNLPKPQCLLNSKVYRAHPQNQRSWIGVPIKPCTTVDEAVFMATNAMRFEIQHMHMQRLANYVTEMRLSLEEPLTQALITLGQEFLKEQNFLGLREILANHSRPKPIIDALMGNIASNIEIVLGNAIDKTILDSIKERLEGIDFSSLNPDDLDSNDRTSHKIYMIISDALVRNGPMAQLFNRIQQMQLSDLSPSIGMPILSAATALCTVLHSVGIKAPELNVESSLLNILQLFERAPLLEGPLAQQLISNMQDGLFLQNVSIASEDGRYQRQAPSKEKPPYANAPEVLVSSLGMFGHDQPKDLPRPFLAVPQADAPHGLHEIIWKLAERQQFQDAPVDTIELYHFLDSCPDKSALSTMLAEKNKDGLTPAVVADQLGVQGFETAMMAYINGDVPRQNFDF